MMEYKGYHADVHYSDEDKLFIGEVFGINDMLGFHGSSVEELENMFHQSIDNYLEMCAEFGKKPEKEYKGVTYEEGEYESLVVTLGNGLGNAIMRAILSVPAIEFGMMGDKILLIETNFFDTEVLSGYFILLPDVDGYSKILTSLGMGDVSISG